MGTKVIADLNLNEIAWKDDRTRAVGRDTPGVFTSFGRTFVAWFQQLRHMGEYRMEIEFSNEDILRLFKLRFGTELREWLVDDEGFTISEELTKRALRTVKLTELTLADLAAMTAISEEPAKAENRVETAKVTPILRRRI
jgi:hypothetical protein